MATQRPKANRGGAAHSDESVHDKNGHSVLTSACHRNTQGDIGLESASRQSRPTTLYPLGLRNRRARDLLGANGTTDEHPIFRHMCYLETVKTYEGTHNIHTLIFGSHVTGI